MKCGFRSDVSCNSDGMMYKVEKEKEIRDKSPGFVYVPQSTVIHWVAWVFSYQNFNCDWKGEKLFMTHTRNVYLLSEWLVAFMKRKIHRDLKGFSVTCSYGDNYPRMDVPARYLFLSTLFFFLILNVLHSKETCHLWNFHMKGTRNFSFENFPVHT